MKILIPKIFLTLFLIVTSSSLFAQRFFPTVDTYIDQYSPTVVENTTNPGKLVVRNYSNAERISFLEFNIANFSEQVSKAELCLYFFAVTNSGTETVDVYEVTSETITNDVTWTGFTGNYTLSSTPITSLDIPSTSFGWCRFNIKNLVNNIAVQSGTNKKIKLALKARTTALLLNFYSSEQTTYAHYKPFLVMTPAPDASLIEKSRSTVTQDGWVGNILPDGYNDEQRLLITYYKNGASKEYRYTNLRFDVPATLNESNRVIIKTKVKSDQCGTNMNYVVDLLSINNLDDATNVNRLTWNTMPALGNYTSLRSRFFNNDDKTNETDIEWDVTNYVKTQKAAGKTKVNFTFQMPELGGAAGDQIAFYARNYLSVDVTSTNIPQLIVYGPNTPSITSFTPATATDGTNVTITGTNFTGATSVSFGGTAASSFSVVNATTINAVVAAGATGSVSVTTSAGTGTKAGFVWVAPSANVSVSTSTNISDLYSTTINTDVTISGTEATLIIDSPKTVKSVTIDAGAKLNLSSNTLTVNDLTIKADKVSSASVSVTNPMIVNGSVKLLKTIDNSKWYFMSFPCQVDIDAITQVSGTGVLGVIGSNWWIKYYDGESRVQNLGTSSNWKQMNAGQTLSANKGYIIGLASSLPGDYVLSFPLNKNLVETIETPRTIPVSAWGEGLPDNKNSLGNAVGENHKGWNLIGIPYLSKFSGSGVGASYLTFHNGTTYTQSSNTSISSINPFEACFIQASTVGTNPTTTNLSFAIDSRQLVRNAVSATTSDCVQLNLMSSTGIDKTNLIMDDNQSEAYEINQDLEKWITTGTDIPQVYTYSNGINYAFNSIPVKNVANLPLGFYVKNAGTVTISVNASQAPGLSKLLLTDKINNVTCDLLTSDYSFTAASGTDNSRFVLTAQRTVTSSEYILIENGVDSPTLANKIESKQLVIGNLKPDNQTEIIIYDAIGRIVCRKSASSNTMEVSLPTFGIYSVQIQSGDKIWSKKIIL